jgi:hypothetical protein
LDNLRWDLNAILIYWDVQPIIWDIYPRYRAPPQEEEWGKIQLQ